MATKRQPSKQRRQSQNQRQRAALQARTAAASETPTGKVGSDPAPAKSGSVLSRLTGTGGSSSSGGTSRAKAASTLPVGHRAALTAVILAATSIVFIVVAFRVPMGAGDEPIITSTDRVAEWSSAALDTARSLEDPTAEDVVAAVDDWSPNGRERYITALFPQSLAVFLPLFAAGLGFRAVRQRRPAKIVNRAMYATLFGALLTVQLLVFFIPTVVAMAVASFQVRKFEFAAKAAEAESAASADAPAEVIDVDEVVEDESEVDVPDVVEDEPDIVDDEAKPAP